MGIIEIFIIALGLSMDAFAVAVCLGLSARPSIKKMLTVGLYFGFFQAAMPLIGFLAGYNLSGIIADYDHWIVFAILCYLGGKMVHSGVNNARGKGPDTTAEASAATPSFKTMLPLSVATSIDALAAGLTFAFLDVNIFSAITIIGLTTFTLSALGVWVGGIFGIKYRARAEIAGGAALVLMGIKVVVEHYL